MEKWSAEKAWNWYNGRPWIRGYNGYPSNCVNRIAMWQEYNHAEVAEQLDYEFGLARKTGLNAVRAIVQFEVWLYEHDSFMKNLEEYLVLAAKHGIGVMLCFGNDCTVPKALYQKPAFGPQPVDWDYHSGIRQGPHSGLHNEPGYMLADEPEYHGRFLEMVTEIGRKYAQDERIQIWDIWNEVGNSRRGMMSVPLMRECFAALRALNPIQPLTADIWSYCAGDMKEPERIALEESDIITFHFYGSFADMVRIVEKLKAYNRPLINNEWLNRIEHNNIDEIFPLFYLERIGSYHWGLIQGFSQTYEPHGFYYQLIDDPSYEGKRDLTKYQHDLYRFSGHPYIASEIELIQRFSRLADERDGFAAPEQN